MAEIWRSARPVAITMRSAKVARPARSMATTASALSSSSEVTITFCNSSSRSGATGRAAGARRGLPAGPATAAFLRGVPGVAASALGTAGLRAPARLRGEAAGFALPGGGGPAGGAGGEGGFLAMVLYSCGG